MSNSPQPDNDANTLRILHANRDLLLHTLQSLNISEIIMHYESYADSGDVTLLEVLPTTQSEQLETGLLIPYQFFMLTRDAQGHYL